MTIDQIAQLQESGSPPNPRLLELQERAREMARCFYDGFGGMVHVMRNDPILYLRTKDESILTDLLASLTSIEDFYSAIPFNDLESKEELTPLFRVRDLLPKLKSSLVRFIREKTEQARAEYNENLSQISKNGREYRCTIEQILKEIRQFPDGKDFKVEVRNPKTGQVAYL